MRNNSPDLPHDSVGHSVTQWLLLFKAGETSAIGPLWRRYYDRLATHAAAALPRAGHIDGEDVAASAFGSFVFGVRDQRFDNLEDRDDLWRVLAMLTDRKVSDELRRRKAVKNGGAFRAADPESLDSIRADALPPDMTVIVDEQFRLLLDSLDEEQRKIALLRLEGYTNDKIASMLGRSLRTITLKLKLIRKIWSVEAAS